MKTIICILFATLPFSAFAQKIRPELKSCMSVQATYFEATADNPKGIYHAGDSDYLTTVLGIDQGKVKASELMAESGQASELVVNTNGACHLLLTYRR